MRISKNFIKIFLILFLITIITTTISLIFNFYSQYFTYTLLIFSFALLFLIFRKQKLGFWFELPKYIFLILLLLVTISSLKFEFIANTPFLKTITNFLLSQQLWLTITTIAFGAITFYLNKDIVGKKIEDEKITEEKKEKKRKQEFDEKYPFWKKFDVSYGIKKSFKEKKFLQGIFRILISPIIFLIKLPYKLVKWMYKEGWWYSVGLILIVVLGFVLYSILATTMVYTIDEGYTLNSIQAYNQYGELGLSISGASYQRATSFTYISAQLYNFLESLNVKNQKILLRAGSIFFALLTITLFYFLAKNISKNKKIAILATFLLSFNWYFIIIAITARNYIQSLFFFTIALLILVKTFLEKNTKKEILLTLFFFLFVVINFIEGFSPFSLHLLIFFVVLKLMKYKFKLFSIKKIILYAFLILSFLIILYNYKNFSLLFIINTFQISLKGVYWEAFMFLGSSFVYIPILGIIFYFLALIHYNRLNSLRSIFSISMISVLLIQIFLFASRRSYPRYLVDINILLFILVTNLIYFYLSNTKKNIKLFGVFLFLIIIITSMINIHQIYNQNLGYGVYQSSNVEKLVGIIPDDAIIITDAPQYIRLMISTHKIYALRDNLYDPELVYINGTHYVSIHQKDSKIKTSISQERFKNYNLSGYILDDEVTQLYLYYDKTPKIMNIGQLKNISKNKTIYFILTHNIFEKINQRDNYQLYKYIEENTEAIFSVIQDKNSFDIRKFDNSIMNPRLVTLLKLN